MSPKIDRGYGKHVCPVCKSRFAELRNMRIHRTLAHPNKADVAAVAKAAFKAGGKAVADKALRGPALPPTQAANVVPGATLEADKAARAVWAKYNRTLEAAIAGRPPGNYTVDLRTNPPQVTPRVKDAIGVLFEAALKSGRPFRVEFSGGDITGLEFT